MWKGTKDFSREGIPSGIIGDVEPVNGVQKQRNRQGIPKVKRLNVKRHISKLIVDGESDIPVVGHLFMKNKNECDIRKVVHKRFITYFVNITRCIRRFTKYL